VRTKVVDFGFQIISIQLKLCFLSPIFLHKT
jgi:hypothetical protein